MVKATKWVLAKSVLGFPNENDFKTEDEELPVLNIDEILVEGVYNSVDPYLRITAKNMKVGELMQGTQVAKVVESKNKYYQVGELVMGNFGWQSHCVIKPDPEKGEGVKLPPQLGKDLSPSLALGIVGMPGATAYFGLLRIAEATSGDVVYVNAAAGAVGSVVGQIAKIKGCKVIGCAGSEEKCDWLRTVGFDYAFNYKTLDVVQELKKAAPDGIDCFFDNVGGATTMQVIAHNMRNYGRVAVCGAISLYNAVDPSEAQVNYPAESIIFKQIKIQGFLSTNFLREYPLAFEDLTKWIREGKLKCREHMVEGFANIPKTWIGLFRGDNIGKAVVKLS